MSDPESPMNNDPISDSSPVRIQSSPPLALLPPPLSSSDPNDASAEPASIADLKIASTPAATKNSRRLPPPCWSLEETIALIDAYRDKWYALNRGNLKANHWEEVAEAVGASCPDVMLKKTAVQCRHKMEKLRKRYRTEIQRARSVPVARFISSWVHFKRMEAMENRPEMKLGNESGDEDKDGGNYRGRYQYSGGGGGGGGSVARTTPRFFNRNGTAGSGGGGGSSSSGGIRIRIPTGVSIAQAGPRFAGKIDQKYTASGSSGMSSKPRAGGGLGGGGSNYGSRVGRNAQGEERIGGKRGRGEMMMMKREDDDDDPMVEIASAIKLLGDTLLRTEQTRMEMTREIEAMRMDTEMKRTKMILESQQRIVEAFAKTISENAEDKKKKASRISSLAADS